MRRFLLPVSLWFVVAVSSLVFVYSLSLLDGFIEERRSRSVCVDFGSFGGRVDFSRPVRYRSHWLGFESVNVPIRPVEFDEGTRPTWRVPTIAELEEADTR